MFVYNVTCNVADEIVEDWLQWMQSIHIPEVLATGRFRNCRLTRVLVQEQDGQTFSVQYDFQTEEDFRIYEEMYADNLREETQKRFGDKVLAFRTLLQILNEQQPES